MPRDAQWDAPTLTKREAAMEDAGTGPLNREHS